MDLLLTLGTLGGLLIGLLHALHLYRARTARQQAGGSTLESPVSALYRGIWTVALWGLFGSYILILWLLSWPVLLLSRLGVIPRRRSET